MTDDYTTQSQKLEENPGDYEQHIKVLTIAEKLVRNYFDLRLENQIWHQLELEWSSEDKEILRSFIKRISSIALLLEEICWFWAQSRRLCQSTSSLRARSLIKSMIALLIQFH